MIELILREDVQSLGKAGALVRVRPGYARNFLLPQGLAYEATEGNKKRIAAVQKSRQTRASSDLTSSQELAARLGGVTVELKAKAGEGNRLFGSITGQDIAAALAGLGFQIDKRKIVLEHPIKQLGVHAVPVHLHHDVHGEVRVTVSPE